MDSIIEELKWKKKISDDRYEIIVIIQGLSTEERITIIYDRHEILINRVIFRYANLPFWIIDNNYKLLKEKIQVNYGSVSD